MKFLTTLALTLCLMACQSSPENSALLPVAFDNPPPLTAEYRSGDGKHSADWRLWRDKGRVEVMQLDGGRGEAWQRSRPGAGEQLFFYRLFHQERTAIEYAPTELSALGIEPQWQRATLLVDPELLAKLEPVRATRVLQREAVLYRGTVNDEQIELVWLTAEQIPARIDRRRGGQRSITLLRALHHHDSSPWQRPQSADYRVIDYADLGDMERDPFVKAVINQLPEQHGHSH